MTTTKSEVAKLQDIAAQVRRDVIRMIANAKSGHPGGSLGCTDLFVALYFDILAASPESFRNDGVGEDMFFLSNGHVVPAWYSTLARRGYFSLDKLGTLRQLGSYLQGHPTNSKPLPGIRIASGSLGQGISVAIGAALAKKANHDNHVVFALCGDGEMQEGQIWEALMFAPAKKVSNLVLIVDYNKKQIDGPVDDVMSLGDLHAKLAAFGWDVIELADGNDMSQVLSALQQAKSLAVSGGCPVVLAHTEMGAGVDFMMGTHKWHGTPPSAEQAEQALSQLPETLGDFKML